jgi:hypothetical protein
MPPAIRVRVYERGNYPTAVQLSRVDWDKLDIASETAVLEVSGMVVDASVDETLRPGSLKVDNKTVWSTRERLEVNLAQAGSSPGPVQQPEPANAAGTDFESDVISNFLTPSKKDDPTFSTLIGSDAPIKAIKEYFEFVELVKKGRLAKFKQRGGLLAGKPDSIILYGPPGGGKSHFANAVRKECASLEFNGSPVTYLEVKWSLLESKWVGDGPKSVEALFDYAERNWPCVMFIDEAVNLMAEQGVNKHSDALKEVFKTRTDGISTRLETAPFLIAATNLHPGQQDSALRDRFARNKFFLGYSSDESTLKLITNILGTVDPREAGALNRQRIAHAAGGISVRLISGVLEANYPSGDLDDNEAYPMDEDQIVRSLQSIERLKTSEWDLHIQQARQYNYIPATGQSWNEYPTAPPVKPSLVKLKLREQSLPEIDIHNLGGSGASKVRISSGDLSVDHARIEPLGRLEVSGDFRTSEYIIVQYFDEFSYQDAQIRIELPPPVSH